MGVANHILLSKAEIDNMNSVIVMQATHQDIIGLEIAVNITTRVNEFDTSDLKTN